MKKIILLLLCSMCITCTNAQTNQAYKRDSLRQSLQKEKTDTGRVLLLAELAYQIHESKPDTAMILALEALSLSRRIGFEKGEAVGLNRVGNVYSSIGNYPKAMEVYLQALRLNEKINNLDGRQRNLGNIGVMYLHQGEYRQALNYQFEAKKLAEQINNRESISIALVNIAQNYFELKAFDSAMFYAQQSYNTASQIKYFRTMGSSHARLGHIHAETGQDNLALEYFRLSIPDLKTAESDAVLSAAFLGMAKVFEKNRQPDSVLFYARESMLLARENGFMLEVRDAGRFLSMYYRKTGNADSAFFYQDITKAANDSLFNQQKTNQMQSLVFDERLRQQEIAAARLKDDEERRHNLQDVIIVICLISFVILFLLLSRSIIVKTKFIEFFGILGLLAVFEFINLFIHPYLAHLTNDSHFLMLMVLIAIGALLIPLHHKLQKWITGIMVEKNKKIRLAAAKKTIANLEGEQTN